MAAKKKTAKKAIKKAPATKKITPKAAKKVAKKAAKKVVTKSVKKAPTKQTTKVAKKVVKKTTQKQTKKVAKQAAVKKATKTVTKAAKKPVVKQAAKKLAKKAVKAVAKKVAKPAAKVIKKSPEKITPEKVVKKVTKEVAKVVAPKVAISTPKKPIKTIELKSTGAPKKNTKILKKKPIVARELTAFDKKQYKRLLDLKDELIDSTAYHAKDTLKTVGDGSDLSGSGQHTADAGSDAYDRDLALNLLSKEQDALYEIQDAIRRIERGVYGYCEISGERIRKERLEAIPFCRLTVEVQARWEEKHGKLRYRRIEEPGYIGATLDY